MLKGKKQGKIGVWEGRREKEQKEGRKERERYRVRENNFLFLPEAQKWRLAMKQPFCNLEKRPPVTEG